MKDDSVANSFATRAKHNADKAMNDFRVTTNMAKAVAKLSTYVKNVTNRQSKTAWHLLKCPNHTGSYPKHALVVNIIMNVASYTRAMHQMDFVALTLFTSSTSRLAKNFERVAVVSYQKLFAFPAFKSLTTSFVGCIVQVK